MGGMSQIVKDAARLFAGFVLTFGLHVVLYGHTTPGGGFPGGVIMAGGFVLLILAYGRLEGALGLDKYCVFSQSMGILLFLLVAGCGLAIGVFFKNFPFGGGLHGEISSGGSILLSTLGITLNVWMGVIAVFLGLAAFRRDSVGE